MVVKQRYPILRSDDAFLKIIEFIYLHIPDFELDSRVNIREIMYWTWASSPHVGGGPLNDDQ
jgi:hypothetical protein